MARTVSATKSLPYANTHIKTHKQMSRPLHAEFDRPGHCTYPGCGHGFDILTHNHASVHGYSCREDLVKDGYVVFYGRHRGELLCKREAINCASTLTNKTNKPQIGCSISKISAEATYKQ